MNSHYELNFKTRAKGDWGEPTGLAVFVEKVTPEYEDDGDTIPETRKVLFSRAMFPNIGQREYLRDRIAEEVESLARWIRNQNV